MWKEEIVWVGILTQYWSGATEEKYTKPWLN